jgi:LmbE family N-acetylglucosaminyl deacetylase
MAGTSMVRHWVSAAACAAALVAGATVACAQVVTDRGAAALGSALAGIGTTGRVLTIGAHPDDEDTYLLAWLARGRHVETAYLSLTRGDGGQNLLGNELGEALGAIRTQELLSARRLDGPTQYFTRAFDFGFSKNAEETYEHWPKDTILGDVVRVVRAFRPQVIVSFWNGTARDGHGHHQVAGLLAREAYELAGDTVRFPVKAFGLAWTPQKFYVSARQAPDSATLRVNVGEYDPVLGRSYFEIAADSRSQHRSQGQGTLRRKGVIWNYLTREATRVGPADAKSERGLFDGIDTTWTALRARIPATAHAALDSALATIDMVRSTYRAQDPSPLVVPLAQAVKQLRAVQQATGRGPAILITVRPGSPSSLSNRAPNEAPPALWDALSLTVRRAEDALLLASGVTVEATATRATFPVREPVKVNVNDSLPVAITVYNRGRTPVRLTNGMIEGLGLRPGETGNVTVLPDSMATLPRWAVSFQTNTPWWRLYGRNKQDWFAAPIDARTEAQHEQQRGSYALVTLDIAGTLLTVTTPVVQVVNDAVLGEQRVPVAAVPGITVNLGSTMEYMRAGVPVERMLPVRITSSYPHEAKVVVRLELPAGLKADSVERERTLDANGSTILLFRLRGIVAEGRLELLAMALHDGAMSTNSDYLISYPHIAPMRLYGASGMYLSAVKVALPPRARVGYIAGLGDKGMEALTQLDIAVEKIEPSQLAGTDLSRFTSIVVGPRAYESSDVLVKQNARLLDYANKGGTLVVQYGAQDMSKFPVTPYPLQWTRPAARVTMEQAPVRVLQPQHPLLTSPNRITDADWKDWVQERATYMPSVIDKRYVPLLGMHDPDEPENQNGLLVAPVGKGRYVYVTLSLFRQLPAGVPGAARILANLVNGVPPVTAPKM